ncbi:hypothetical protein SARC_02349 [Sphaeroforma arctica JP610]|uniref:Uncharacterized protein n=1 Tax=Sphaeroforma arctica JP610 TaxID=667725 RepID=A0A0L0G985_9EUKA|nr:hypothetical protein SARC_02349 [Sphaeroforma arctica JP610]KNC85479.1 hypothetical protein SARC_02349 [Sphaeroforma arctica JP610]|eukprot:XP_014159381.1 hypothetical protein SARC_02349 [Sphaeroforma arctica JP610]
MKFATIIAIQLAGGQLAYARLNDDEVFANSALTGRRPTSLRRMSSLFGAVWEPTALKAGSVNCYIDGVDVGFHCLMRAADGADGQILRDNVNARTCEEGEASTASIDWKKARDALLFGQVEGYITGADGNQVKGPLVVSDAGLEELLQQNRDSGYALGLLGGDLYSQFLSVGIRRLMQSKRSAETSEKQFYNIWISGLRELISAHDVNRPDGVADNDVHCHGSDQSHQYQHVVSDHLQRGYYGELSCACGYKSLGEYILPGTEETTKIPWQSIENDPNANPYLKELWSRIKMHTLDGVASDCDITTSTRGQRRYDFNRAYGVQEIEGVPRRFIKIGNDRTCGTYGNEIGSHAEDNPYRWVDKQWGARYLNGIELDMYNHFVQGVNARCKSQPAVKATDRQCYLTIETTCVTKNDDGTKETTTTQMTIPDKTGGCVGFHAEVDGSR